MRLTTLDFTKQKWQQTLEKIVRETKSKGYAISHIKPPTAFNDFVTSQSKYHYEGYSPIYGTQIEQAPEAWRIKITEK